MPRVPLECRSGRSLYPVRLEFVNLSERPANIIWIDYQGHEKNFGTLQPDGVLNVESYDFHPWIADDAKTRSRLLLNKTDIYYPVSPEDHLLPPMMLNADLSPKRDAYKKAPKLRVDVTLPVLSLWDLCVESVVNCLDNLDQLKDLNLPARLKTKIQNRFSVQ